MRGQRGMVAAKPGAGQLAGDLGLGRQPVGLGQPRGPGPQPRGQGAAATAQHDMQGRTLSPAGATEARGHQHGDLVGQGRDVFEALALARHAIRIDGMAAAHQTP